MEWLLTILDKVFGPLMGRWVTARALDLEHDKRLFKKLDRSVNEVFLNELLNSRLYNNWCRHKDALRLGHFIEDFRRQENQFLDRKVRKALAAALDDLDAIDTFIAKHFFAGYLGTNDDSLRLYPELRDREAPEYYARSEELNARLGPAWDSYTKFRATAKRRLRV